MSATDEVAGVFEVIDQQSSAHDPVDQTQVSDTAQAEGSESTTEAETTQTQDSEPTEQNTESQTTDTGTSEEGQTENTESQDTAETLTTEKTEQDFSNWKDALPPAPQGFQGKEPEYDDFGNIVNMTPQDYNQYIIDKAAAASDERSYQSLVQQQAFIVAEQLLPEIKTNPAVRQLVQNVQLGGVVAGQDIDPVKAAQIVKDALGISTEKLAAAKAEGINSTKASITVQKAAALETSSTQTQVSDDGDKVTNLQKRIKKGDDNAFAELLDLWQEQGVIN